MTAEAPKSTLEIIEDYCYTTIATAKSPDEMRDALTELGFVHLAMEPSKIPLAIQEIWASMHGRSGIQNLGIIATTIGTIFNSGQNLFTQEYAVSKARQTK